MNQQNNSIDIIREARKLSKQLIKTKVKTDLKIAVLGTSSIQYFVMVLRYLIYKEGLNPEIYEGEYDGIAMDVFDENSELYVFNPDIVIVITHYLDIKRFPNLLDCKREVENLLDNTCEYYSKVWDALNKIDNVHVLQSNFVIPPLHILGNLETEVCYSKTSFLMYLNQRLCEIAPEFVTMVDLELVAEYIGKYNWFDFSGYFLSKSACKMEYLPEMVGVFKKQILALKGRIRKCLVLDLDNTLWGGIVGDEGYDGIQIDPNNAVGEAYRYFQSYLLELKRRGIILAVCSKNDEINAKEPFEKNPNMILKLDDISCFVANWDDKATNIRRIAQKLNIGLDSLVFFDDNPAEREIIRTYLPEVYVVDVPEDPALYAVQLDRSCTFEWMQLTKEDLLRSNSYIENRNREALETEFVNYDDYLRALEMKGQANILTQNECGRFVQLLNKSNQFNLRTQRYTEADILNRISDRDSECVYVRLQDRFSEYGIISCVILRKKDDYCFIESWVMSCRVLKRNVEKFMFDKVIEVARNMGSSVLLGEYIPSKKNTMVENFYDSLGFEFVNDKDGIKQYMYRLANNCNMDDVYIERM